MLICFQNSSSNRLSAKCWTVISKDSIKLLSWPGFPPYVQRSSLLFSSFCSRFGVTCTCSAAIVYVPLTEVCRMMFTAPIVCECRLNWDTCARRGINSCRSRKLHKLNVWTWLSMKTDVVKYFLVDVSSWPKPCDVELWTLPASSSHPWSGSCPQPTFVAVKRSWTGGRRADKATPSRVCNVRNAGIAVVGCHQRRSMTPSSSRLVPSNADVVSTHRHRGRVDDRKLTPVSTASAVADKLAPATGESDLCSMMLCMCCV